MPPSVGRRCGTVRKAHHGLMALLAFGCTSGEPTAPEGATTNWHACEVTADCTWAIGGGGWPVATRADSASAYLDWVQSQAPFTTYFMPGDCFARPEEFHSYVASSKSSVACLAGSCTLELKPTCAK